MSKLFAVADVHGFYDEMIAALDEAGFDKENPEHRLVVCGDIFDRGRKPRETLQYLQDIGNKLVFVRGNHEDLLEDCMNEIARGWIPSRHHWSNKTVQTICDLCGIEDYDLFGISDSTKDKVYRIIHPILLWIHEKAVDYYEAGDYIFVHGWMPCDSDDPIPYHARRKLTLIPREEWDCENYIQRKGMWDAARWIDPVNAYQQGCVIPGKTTVCGHWHASAGHSKLHGNGPEFGEGACFDIFKDEGIIMLDACTAVSHKVNVLVIEADSRNG